MTGDSAAAVRSGSFAPVRTDVVVIGLGAFGSAALWRLAERGVDVVGLERFGVGHPFGSSHGITRLFRVACQEHPGLSPIAGRTRDLWRELEDRYGQELVRQSGCLSVGSPGSTPITGTLAAAAGAGLPVVRMGHDELVARYPQYAGLGATDEAVLDPEAGICFPERAVRAHVRAASEHGAVVYTDTRVVRLELTGDGVVAHTPTTRVVARQAVVGAGAWLGQLVPGLPLQPRRVPLFWFRARDPRDEGFALERFPAFIRQLPDGRVLWGHGSDSREGFGIKIGMEDQGHNFSDTDPDEVDRGIHPDTDIAQLSAWVADAFPGVDPVPAGAAPCMITTTPDHQFVVGRPGGDPRLVVAGGDSGHGFKHAAGIGELLAGFTLGETPYTDVGFLSPDRFPASGNGPSPS
ncbi:N-methyl-L-tryptophan oxidase [Streptomyces shenzhenensis]|uniref:N-methyl-L-tryptophan oxidase n=1 Tax=Streptomyces shenzhenensis TaxID=943815 RepID=UPI00340CDE56